MYSARKRRRFRRFLAGVILVSWVPMLGWGCGGGGSCRKPPPAQNRVTTAVGAGQEGCAAATCGGAQAYSGTGTLQVPAGASELFIASLGDTANPDLNQAQVTLTSPTGTQSIRFANGAVTMTGFTARSLAEPTTDAALEAYCTTLAAGLPAKPTPEQVMTLLGDLKNPDPANPPPAVPAAVYAGIDAHRALLDGYQDTVATSTVALKPTDGVIVFGPDPGKWTLAVQSNAGAGKASLIAWAIPAGADSSLFDHIGAALVSAGAPTLASIRPAAACTGCDPGCVETLKAFREPPAGTPEYYRAKAIGALWFWLRWALFRGLFTAGIGKILDLVNKEIQLTLGLTFEGLKDRAIFSLVCIYAVLKVVPETACDIFWRMAYCYTQVDRYCQICYLGLVTPYGPSVVPRYNMKPPPLELEAGDSLRVELCGFNMDSQCIIRQYWGHGGPGYHSPANWTIGPSGLATITASGDRQGFCTVKSPLDPTVTSGTLTATIGQQPARGEFQVKVAAKQNFTLSPKSKTISKCSEAIFNVTYSGPGLPPGTTFEFAWDSTKTAGSLFSRDGAQEAPFTTPGNSAVYRSGTNTGTDTVTVKVIQISSTGARAQVATGTATVTVKQGEIVSGRLVVWGPIYWLEGGTSHYEAGVAVVHVFKGSGPLPLRVLRHMPGEPQDLTVGDAYPRITKASSSSAHGGVNVYGLAEDERALMLWGESQFGVNSSPPMSEEESAGFFNTRFGDGWRTPNSELQKAQTWTLEILDR